MKLSELPGYNPDVVALPDEKCFGVLEVDLFVTNSKGARTDHRFQIIDFLRGNTKLRQVRDLNELKLYSMLDHNLPYRHWALLDHSVAECLEIADAARERGRNRAKEMALRTSTLIPDLIEQQEIKQKVFQRASHFGPRSGGRTAGVQRN